MQGKPWIDYITRASFFCNRAARFRTPLILTARARRSNAAMGPGMPKGYDFDAVDADVLLHGATVENGPPDTGQWRKLWRPGPAADDINMTPQMLDCIRKLIREGATVVGPQPQHSPSLDDYPACDRQVRKPANTFWSNCNGTTVQEHRYGKGRIVLGESLADVFAQQNLKPDFEFHGDDPATSFVYVHRVAGDADIYFVSNQRGQFDSADCTFRVNGKARNYGTPKPAPFGLRQSGMKKAAALACTSRLNRPGRSLWCSEILRPLSIWYRLNFMRQKPLDCPGRRI